jgi:hypothetical protein
MVKVLWRDRKGWFVLARRLDRDLVVLPRDIPEGTRSITVDAKTLAALLEGGESRGRPTRSDIAHAARAAAERERITSRNTQLPT